MTLRDQMNREVKLNTYPPKRIISLVPSQTELLADLGLDDEVVGITKFCVHPEAWFRNKQRVGGTKKVKKDVVHDLQPDLIIGNKEENTREDIEYLQKHYPVWMSDIVTIPDALDMIAQLGIVTQKEKEAKNWINKINEARKQLPALPNAPTVAYFIWRNPWMVVGNHTYIHEFLEACGFQNAFAEQSRYPEVELKKLGDKKIDIVFLSSEPFPFKDKHIAEIKEYLPDAHIELINGEMFSWYGSRMQKGFDYVSHLIKQL